MKIETYKVKQYNSTYKHVLVVDGKPIVITKSENKIIQCVSYLSNKNEDIKDGKIKRILDEIGTRVD